jgi:dTMP kinase
MINPKELNPKARLIVLEGIDGVGKTTQVKLLYEYLRVKGVNACEFREPGGTAIGERVRPLLKVKGVIDSDMCAMLMFAALRAELMHTQVMPRLKSGETILLDRSLYSTIAYQGYGKGMSVELIKAIDSDSLGVSPSDIIYFAGGVGYNTDSCFDDAYETLGDKFRDRVVEGYEFCHGSLELPDFTKKHRIDIIKGDRERKGMEIVHQEVLDVLGMSK